MTEPAAQVPFDAEFLARLTKEFLNDPDHYLDAFRDALAALETDAAASVRRLWQVSHGMKSDAQAVGLVKMAALVEEFENGLTIVNGHVKALARASAWPEPVRVRLAQCFAECFSGVESCYVSLRENPDEVSAPFAEAFEAMENLKAWSPDLPAAFWAGETGLASRTNASPTSVSKPMPPSLPSTQNASSKMTSEELKGIAAGQPPEETAGTAQAPSSQIHLLLSEGGSRFALPMEHVLEILAARRWTPLPVAKGEILGVLSLRGAILPVFRFPTGRGAPSRGVSTSQKDENEDGSIVVIRAAERTFGLRVDAVSHVVEVDAAVLQSAGELAYPAAATENVTQAEPRGLITHVGLVDGATTLFVNPARLVSA